MHEMGNWRWWDTISRRANQRGEERAKEDLEVGIEAMDQGHPEKTEHEHRVIGPDVNDFGCCMLNQSPTVGYEMMVCLCGDRRA